MLVDLGGGGCIIQGEGLEGPEGLEGLEGQEDLEDVRGLWRTASRPAPPLCGHSRCARPTARNGAARNSTMIILYHKYSTINFVLYILQNRIY